MLPTVLVIIIIIVAFFFIIVKNRLATCLLWRNKHFNRHVALH